MIYDLYLALPDDFDLIILRYEVPNLSLYKVLFFTLLTNKVRGQVPCLTESSSQLNIMLALHCRQYRGGDPGYFCSPESEINGVSAPDQGVLEVSTLGVDCSVSHRQAKTPRVQATPFSSVQPTVRHTSSYGTHILMTHLGYRGIESFQASFYHYSHP